MTTWVDEDSSLVRAAAAGDVPAFEALYRRHVGKVHGVIWRLAGGVQARADELVQEAFLRAWQRLGGFRHESRFSTWLHRLAVNTALMELRSARSRPEATGVEMDEDLLPATSNSADLRLDLEKAVLSLPPRARAVLVLHDIEGWEHQEIAAQLDIATGTSKAQLHRARNLLRRQLEEQT
jgi:RNA polymerase sigma factor (sigma-70 family)